jgi:hypothetical protein
MAQEILFDPAYILTLYQLSSTPSTNRYAGLRVSRITTKGRLESNASYYFRKCNYNYGQIYMYYGQILYKVALISPQSLLHYRHTFSTFEWHAVSYTV